MHLIDLILGFNHAPSAIDAAAEGKSLFQEFPRRHHHLKASQQFLQRVL